MSKSITFILLLGFVVVASAGKTKCQLARDKASKSKNPDLLVPECDKNGEFKPMQCHKKTGLCLCFNNQGKPVNKPSKDLKSCECIIKSAAASAAMLPGGFGPQCEDNGLYSKMQCYDWGKCQCVNQETGEPVGKAVRGTLNC